MAFDAEKTVRDIAHLVPDGTEIVTLDEIRLPADRLTNKTRYLDPLNFATNFAFFRDGPDGRGDRLHTRIATANYWHRYGAENVNLWLSLIDTDGKTIGQWDLALPDPRRHHHRQRRGLRAFRPGGDHRPAVRARHRGEGA